LKLADRLIAQRTARFDVELGDLKVFPDADGRVLRHPEEEWNFAGQSLAEQLAGGEDLIGPRHSVVGLKGLVLDDGHGLDLIADLARREDHACIHLVPPVHHQRVGGPEVDAFERGHRFGIAVDDRIPVQVQRLRSVPTGLENDVLPVLRL